MLRVVAQGRRSVRSVDRTVAGGVLQGGGDGRGDAGVLRRPARRGADLCQDRGPRVPPAGAAARAQRQECGGCSRCGRSLGDQRRRELAALHRRTRPADAPGPVLLGSRGALHRRHRHCQRRTPAALQREPSGRPEPGRGAGPEPRRHQW